MTIERSQIREGMTVYSADGEKLGKVLTCDDQTFIVEKGFFFPKDYVARYEDVVEASGDEIHLQSGREALRSLDEIQGRPDADVTRAPIGASGGSSGVGAGQASVPADAGLAAGAAGFGAEPVSIPFREDEDEIRKRPVVQEEVRSRAERVTEQRAADAEVRKERVDIEEKPGAFRDDPSLTRDDPNN